MKVGDFVYEPPNQYGIVLTCGPVKFDVVWLGGSTSRYKHGVRDVEVVEPAAVDKWSRKLLLQEAANAKAERARGAGIKRGQVWP